MTARARGLLLSALVALAGALHLAGFTSDRPVVAGRWSSTLFALIVALILAANVLTVLALAWRRQLSPPTVAPRAVTLGWLVAVTLVYATAHNVSRSQAAVATLCVVAVTCLSFGWLSLVLPQLLGWSPSPTQVRRAVLASTALLVALVMSEVAARMLSLDPPRGSPVVRYRPHPYLVYAPAPETFAPALARFWQGSLPPAKPRGVIRIVCFGGSTTEEGWPEDLETELRRRDPRPPVEVLNAGVASYTSAENLAALVVRGTDTDADIIVLEHGVNDVRPRVYPDYRRDFSHYRKPWKLTWAESLRGLNERAAKWSHLARLLSQRVAPFQSLEHVTTFPAGQREDRRDAPLDPTTVVGFERNTVAFVRIAKAYGAAAVLVTEPLNDTPSWRATAPRYVSGVAEHNDLLRTIATREGVVVADAATALAGRDKLFIDIVHTTPDGRKEKARVVADALRRAGLLSRQTNPTSIDPAALAPPGGS